jgi:hypothetical protein
VYDFSYIPAIVKRLLCVFHYVIDNYLCLPGFEKGFNLYSLIMDGSSLIRKLPPGVVYDLVHMLEIRDAWKQLMAVVPRERYESDDCYMPKYRVEHIK